MLPLCGVISDVSLASYIIHISYRGQCDTTNTPALTVYT